ALSGVIDSVEDPCPSFEVNVAGSFQLLELARAANVRHIINASTGGALLGEAASPISEEMAPCPLSPYGASKLAVEGYCSAFAGAYGLSCVTLRFSNIYGPRSAHKKSVVAPLSKASFAASRSSSTATAPSSGITFTSAIWCVASKRRSSGSSPAFTSSAAVSRHRSARSSQRSRRFPDAISGSITKLAAAAKFTRLGAISPKRRANSVTMLQRTLKLVCRQRGAGIWRTARSGYGSRLGPLRIDSGRLDRESRHVEKSVIGDSRRGTAAVDRNPCFQ